MGAVGNARRVRVQQKERSTGNTADEFRRIPRVLATGRALGVGADRATRDRIVSRSGGGDSITPRRGEREKGGKVEREKGGKGERWKGGKVEREKGRKVEREKGGTGKEASGESS
jgi:hypothetical protein